MGPLVCCASVLEPKGHHLVAESSPQSDEGCLFHILRCHLYLIIARKPIHERKQGKIGHVIYKNIDVQ